MALFRILRTYLTIYAHAVKETARAIARNAWTLVLPVGLLLAVNFISSLAATIPLIGGVLIVIVYALAASAYLYFLGELVRQSRVRPNELRTGLVAYLTPVINVSFILWLVSLLAGFIASSNRELAPLLPALIFIEYLLLNALPETIYLRGEARGLDALVSSIKFLQENWIEWFIPNLLLLGIWYAAKEYVPWETLGFTIGEYAATIFLACFVHFAMTFRGFLYQVLRETSHRQRVFRFGGGE